MQFTFKDAVATWFCLLIAVLLLLPHRLYHELSRWFGNEPCLLEQREAEQKPKTMLANYVKAPQFLPKQPSNEKKETPLPFPAVGENDPECRALWQETIGMDLGAFGALSANLEIKVDDPIHLVSAILDLSTRHWCSSPPKKYQVDVIEDRMQKACKIARDGTGDAWEFMGKAMKSLDSKQHLAAGVCFDYYMRFRYASVRLLTQGTPTSAIADVGLLVNMYMGQRYYDLPLPDKMYDVDAIDEYFAKRDPAEMDHEDDRSDEILKRILEIDPSNALASIYLLDRTYNHVRWVPPSEEGESAEQFAAYSQAMDMAMRNAPDHPFVLATQMNYAASREDYSEMRRLAEQITADYPQSSLGPYYMAWYSAITGDRQSALDILQSVIDRDPGNVDPETFKASFTLTYLKSAPDIFTSPADAFSAPTPAIGYSVALTPDFSEITDRAPASDPITGVSDSPLPSDPR